MAKVTLGVASGVPLWAKDIEQPIINEFNLPTATINGYPIDATVTEAHSYESDVTEYPVENGSSIADNVRDKPLKVTMEGIVTDSPIGAIANHSTRKSGLASDVSLAMLLKLRAFKEPCTISTSLGVYKNMVLSSLSIPRESGEAMQLHFKADFVQVLIVTNNRTTIRVAIPGGNGSTSLGARLAKLGLKSVSVFTPLPLDKTVYPLPPLFLTDSLGKHYLLYPGSPPADGYVDKDGYHGFSFKNKSGLQLEQATLNHSTGLWKNSKGEIVKFSPTVGGAPVSQAGKDSAEDQIFDQLAGGADAPAPTKSNGIVGKDVPSLF